MGLVGPIQQVGDGGIRIGQGTGAQAGQHEHQWPVTKHRGECWAPQRQVDDQPGGALGQRAEDVLDGPLREVGAGPTAGRQHVHAILGRQPGRKGTRRQAPTHVTQVVPSLPGQVLDARSHLQPSPHQVEVDDDGIGACRGKTAGDGEGQGARAQAPGRPDDGDDGVW